MNFILNASLQIMGHKCFFNISMPCYIQISISLCFTAKDLLLKSDLLTNSPQNLVKTFPEVCMIMLFKVQYTSVDDFMTKGEALNRKKQEII